MPTTLTDAEQEQRWTDWLDDDNAGAVNLDDPLEATHIVNATLEVAIPLRLPPWVDPDEVLAAVLERLGDHTAFDLANDPHGYWNPPEYLVAEDHDPDGVMGGTGTIEEVTS